jgi:hypothetical protein
MVNGAPSRPVPTSSVVMALMPAGSVRSSKSTITTMCGNARPASAPTASGRVGYTMRARPSASVALGCRLCGNHFSQSQWARLRSLIAPMIINWSGACRTANWQIIARSSARA